MEARLPGVRGPETRAPECPALNRQSLPAKSHVAMTAGSAPREKPLRVISQVPSGSGILKKSS